MRHVDRDDYLDERDSHLQGEGEQVACEWCDGTGGSGMTDTELIALRAKGVECE